MKKFFVLLLTLLFVGALSAQEMIDFKGWYDDDYYLELKEDKEGEKRLYKTAVKNGKSKLYKDTDFSAEVNAKLPKGYMVNWRTVHTKDYNTSVLEKDNNLYVYKRETEQFKQLTANPSEDKVPAISPDENKVAFVRDGDLYVVDLNSGLERKYTDDGSDVVYNGYASWVYYEEILGRASRYRAYWWSPDSKKIAFLRFDDTPVPTFPLYKADGVHGELEITHYPKAGDPNPDVTLYIIDLETGEKTWVASNCKEDIYIAWPYWTKDSKQLLYQVMNRDQDNIKFYLADAATGDNKVIYDESQKSWVIFFEDIYTFRDGSGFMLRSDKSGWMNLYYYDYEGNLIAQVTDVDWRVNEILKVDEAKGEVYFMGTGGKSIDRQLFKAKLDGSGMEQLTRESGVHNIQLSPNNKYFFDTWSNVSTPNHQEIGTVEGKIVIELGHAEAPSPTAKGLGKVEMFTIKTDDGFELPAYWILPANFDENEKYGVVFQIYGGPDAGMIRNRYINPKGNYMTQNGIIRFSVDHRGSGHFGKDGLAYMHRSLGKWEIEDYITAVQWLLNHDFVDSTKIGITGGSYGGYLSCLALTLAADYFTHGVGSAAVTDWHLYDNVYTERYMDTPEQNPEGYEFGSVMTHAEKYKGKLYVMHGTMDDNVHMQNIIQLVDKFTDLNKDFDFMLYPNGRHGWGAPKYYHSAREIKEFWLEHFTNE